MVAILATAAEATAHESSGTPPISPEGGASAEPEKQPRLIREQPGRPQRIVNGLLTFDFPSTVALLNAGSGSVRCSGTFVGCRTVLTAAHCVCSGDGEDCGADGLQLVDAATLAVFAQSVGILAVDSIDVPPGYRFGVAADVALLHLAVAADGIAPARINTVASPGLGTTATIAGFGLSAGGAGDVGLKRAGNVVIAPCTVVPQASHVCWDFESPLGAPGTDSNTCSGDSGGPLFADLGAGQVVAGVTSGGISSSCLPSDNSFDADVFIEHAWIEAQAGSDLRSTPCGGSETNRPGTETLSATGSLDTNVGEVVLEVELPIGLERLRVTLNGDDRGEVFLNQFDLYVRQGEAPSDSIFDCRSSRSGVFEICDLPSPVAGTWFLRVKRETGDGTFQMTVTLFGTPIFTDGFESGDTSAWTDLGSSPGAGRAPIRLRRSFPAHAGASSKAGDHPERSDRPAR